MVVEDDPLIRDLIRMYLEKAEYKVVLASDGVEAQELFLRDHPCLVVLDLMLPKLSGEDFCAWALEHNPELSIIMLSAKVGVQDRIAGLKMGADDYMTKPFDPAELVAQVEAVLRRTGAYCQKLAYDGLCIMPRKGETVLYDQEIDLTAHEFQLLYLFMGSPSRVFTREELILQLYPHREKEILDRTIDVHIKKLREKIEENPSAPKRIQTVRGMGYKFVTL